MNQQVKHHLRIVSLICFIPFSKVCVLTNLKFGVRYSLSSILMFFFLYAIPGTAQDTYYQHFIFDNSLSDTAYYYSGSPDSVSQNLNLHHHKIPVSEKRFKSPPNALFFSVEDNAADWQAEILVNFWRNRPISFQGNTLSFWIFSAQNLSGSPLFSVQIVDQTGKKSNPATVTVGSKNSETSKWHPVRIPLSEFKNADPFTISKLVLTGQKTGSGSLSFYLDDIKIDAATENAQPPAVPANLKASGYAAHIDLVWEPNTDNDLQSYLIYRSLDGKNFEPIGIQTSFYHRFTDFIGARNQEVYYRITALDKNYNESAPTAPVAAATIKMTDEELLTMVQEATFRYYWEGAHPNAGLALENMPADPNLVAIGAGGFGIMAILAGIERKFITREQGTERITTIIKFLEKADRFHGVWPHFLDGNTGKTIALFGKYDNGGDLVETAFLVQGLLAARQYFDQDNPAENFIRQHVTALWESVAWDWYRKTPDSEYLYWHWSPEYEWHINHKLIGWNETMIVYLLAIASPTHPVPAALYYSGWASQSEEARAYRSNWGKTDDGSQYANRNTYYGKKLEVGVSNGGPLFFIHYAYLGFDPRNKRDRYTNYFDNNRTIALINQAYCKENPGNYQGYSEAGWGLTASDDPWGYKAHEPVLRMDNGTLTPTGAIASFPYTPEPSMKALKYFYYNLGDKVWGIYGFIDAFNLTQNWFSPIYMGLNQAPMTVMIENYRTGLIWNNFMKNPEITQALKNIGFQNE